MITALMRITPKNKEVSVFFAVLWSFAHLTQRAFVLLLQSPVLALPKPNYGSKKRQTALIKGYFFIF
jgi:hypothetical protein